jgi:hypothetical protein
LIFFVFLIFYKLFEMFELFKGLQLCMHEICPCVPWVVINKGNKISWSWQWLTRHWSKNIEMYEFFFLALVRLCFGITSFCCFPNIQSWIDLVHYW